MCSMFEMTSSLGSMKAVSPHWSLVDRVLPAKGSTFKRIANVELKIDPSSHLGACLLSSTIGSWLLVS